MNRPLPLPRMPGRALPALLALMICAFAQAQRVPGPDGDAQAIELPPVYRVELLAFAHITGDSDRLPATDPADFTDVTDPLLVAEANRFADAAWRSMRRLLPFPPPRPEVDQATPYLESERFRLQPIPPAYSALGDLSPVMQRTLDRLIASPDHEILLTRSWTQQAEPRRPTPRLRLHDQAPVATRAPQRAIAPPWIPVDLRIPVALSEDGELRYKRLFRPRPPRLHRYRFDGSARLRQRQFLHLDLELVWQQRDAGLDGTAADDEPNRLAGSAARSASPPDAEQREWVLHRLQQSRVIQPGRLEYFDSSRFGVLALVHRFEQIVPEPEPDAPEPTPADPAAPPAGP